MSVQFGRWNIDGLPVDREYLTKAGEMLAPYGPDGGDAYIKDNAGILYRAFHTTKESRKETQPFVTSSGAVLCWDGRLDNRQELVQELREKVKADSTDLAIVAAAYEGCGTKSFAKLIGDWALSVWDPKSRSVILAKDPIGTRHLYYSSDQKQITWSTILDPLVLLSEKKFSLEEEYIAGWLSFFPATHLTPYVGIHSVPPSCFVRLEPGRETVSKYWDFDPSKRIRYRTDGEYEEHFRQVFRESVQRRLRSDSPVLAELSGGMDSSSIVCMADKIIVQGGAQPPRLDTVSYYDDSEPNWNERPYFTIVEKKRRRVGCHIDVSKNLPLRFEFEGNSFAAIPGTTARRSEAGKQFAACVTSQGNRVILSGTGGDEVTGGVPTPHPELMDLLASLNLRKFTRQLKLWALNMRKPWFLLMLESIRGLSSPVDFGIGNAARCAPWLQSRFVESYHAALTGYSRRLSLVGAIPSFKVNVSTFDGLRRQLGSEGAPHDPAYEKRYPFLDRGLVEFLFAIPRAQLLRPGRRRSLMRRALAEVVPSEILCRRRKAFGSRGLLSRISSESADLTELCAYLESSTLGIVDIRGFHQSLDNVRCGQAVPVVTLVRTLGIEFWLRMLRRSGAPIEIGPRRYPVSLNATASDKRTEAAPNPPIMRPRRGDGFLS